jgi:ubiquinone/menaquinone biosynthesis C-methylase UbiE
MTAKLASTTRKETTIADRVHFKMMSFVHETLYGVFRDPYKVLDAAGLQPGQRVLEVGCGPGFFTVPAARIAGEEGGVCALDISPLAVDHVQRKVRAEGATNVEIVLADAARTELPDQSFDLAFVFGFANPIGGMEAIWAELYRLLRPAGTLAVEGQLQPPSKLFAPVKRQGRIAQFRKIG